MFDHWMMHYCAHVHTAIRFWMEHHQDQKDTALYVQMEDIRARAEKAFNEKRGKK